MSGNLVAVEALLRQIGINVDEKITNIIHPLALATSLQDNPYTSSSDKNKYQAIINDSKLGK